MKGIEPSTFSLQVSCSTNSVSYTHLDVYKRQGLWGYAQEQGLVKTEAVWQANRGSHWFSDYSPTQFRLPDLRDMFRRFTGTDADTANARAMASRQNGAIQTHTHTLILQRSGGGVNTAMRVVNGGNNWWPFNANGSESEFMTVESNQGRCV